MIVEKIVEIVKEATETNNNNKLFNANSVYTYTESTPTSYPVAMILGKNTDSPEILSSAHSLVEVEVRIVICLPLFGDVAESAQWARIKAIQEILRDDLDNSQDLKNSITVQFPTTVETPYEDTAEQGSVLKADIIVHGNQVDNMD